MKRWLRLALYGLAVYLLFVIILFPADRTFALLQQRNLLPLQAYQVTGTLWSGTVGMVEAGNYRLENVAWRLHPWQLVTGSFEVAVKIGDDAQPIAFTLGRNFDGSHYISSSSDELSVGALESVLMTHPLGLVGGLQLDLHNIRIADKRLAGFEGVVMWQNAGLGAPLNMDVGSFAAEFKQADNGVRGTIKDVAGPLTAEGDLVIPLDGSYQLSARVAINDPQRSELAQALRYLGSPSPGGQVNFSRAGRLPF